MTAESVPSSEPCRRCAQRIAEARVAQVGSPESCDTCALIRGFVADRKATRPLHADERTMTAITEAFTVAIRKRFPDL